MYNVPKETWSVRLALTALVVLYLLRLLVLEGATALGTPRAPSSPHRELLQEENTGGATPATRRVTIREFSLEDGTRCVALVGMETAALSCHWRVQS